MAAGRRQRPRRTWVSGLPTLADTEVLVAAEVRRKCQVGCRSMGGQPSYGMFRVPASADEMPRS